jgi:hypothetical protein
MQKDCTMPAKNINEKSALLDEFQLACSILREYEKAHPGVTRQWDEMSTAKRFGRYFVLDVNVYGSRIREVLGDRCPSLTRMSDGDLVRKILSQRRGVRNIC